MQGALWKWQLEHGWPLVRTSQRTFRRRQVRQALAARIPLRIFLAAGGDEPWSEGSERLPVWRG
jgi:hypothetical protein